MVPIYDRIIVAGGAGFLGRLLLRDLGPVTRDWVILTRDPERIVPQPENVRVLPWDGRTLGPWARELEGAEALINLAGRTVNCRYHARNRREILDSRTLSTRILGEAIGQCEKPPPAWLNGASATIYRHSIDQPMDEITGEIGTGFSVGICRAWEDALAEKDLPGTRRVALRAAMVLDEDPDSVFRWLKRIVRLRLGGKMGPGTQYMSWIHGRDFTRAVEWILRSPSMKGAVNLCAPHPVPNAEAMEAFRSAAGVSFGLPATRWMLELGTFLLRTETELVLKSRRVVPQRLLDAGFEFLFPKLEGALCDLSPIHAPATEGRKITAAL